MAGNTRRAKAQADEDEQEKAKEQERAQANRSKWDVDSSFMSNTQHLHFQNLKVNVQFGICPRRYQLAHSLFDRLPCIEPGVFHKDSILNIIKHEFGLFLCLEHSLCNSVVLFVHCIKQDHCLHNFRDDNSSCHEVLEVFIHCHDVDHGVCCRDLLGDCVFELVKIAEGPVWPKAVCRASHVALAVVVLVATAATEGFTQRRINL